MRRKITVFLIIAVCYLLQSTVFQALSFASISPNLMIVVVSAFGFMRGKKEGLWIGFFTGLLLDVFTGSILGFYALLYMYVGYFNGFFRKMFYPEDIKLPMLLIAVSDFSCSLIIYFLLFLIALAMVFPLVFAVSSALKPLDELFLFPPKVFAQNPTMDNFQDLFVTMGKSWVTFSRYIFNTVFITVVGTAGHLIIASMGAFVLAKYEFPGSKLFFSIVVTALMFNGYVTAIPNYLIISKLGWIDTYWAIIVPAFAAPMGLFLMKQFMEGLPMSLVEAAMIDGASRWKIFIQIIMPNVKPAWLTLIIFSVQNLWNNKAATFIYSEEKKTLVYALQQIQSGGIARTGQAEGGKVVVMVVPILIFVLSESQILETMASSGLKD